MFEAVLETVTSILNVITDVSKDIDSSTKLQSEMNLTYTTMIKNIKTKCQEQLQTHNSTIQLLHDKYFNAFCQKCDEYSRNFGGDFDTAMNQNFSNYESKIRNFE